MYKRQGYEGACLLEWGEQFQDELTDEYLSVTLKRDEGDSDVRTITLEAVSYTHLDVYKRQAQP